MVRRCRALGKRHSTTNHEDATEEECQEVSSERGHETNCRYRVSDDRALVKGQRTTKHEDATEEETESYQELSGGGDTKCNHRGSEAAGPWANDIVQQVMKTMQTQQKTEGEKKSYQEIPVVE